MRDIYIHRTIYSLRMGRIELSYHPVLEQDKESLDRIIKSIGWTDFNPDVAFGRSAFFFLNRALYTDNHQLVSVQAKKICDANSQPLTPPSTKDFYNDETQEQFNTTFDQFGNRVVSYKILRPRGSGSHSDAEYEDHFISMINSTAFTNTPYALGFGEYLDQTYVPETLYPSEKIIKASKIMSNYDFEIRTPSVTPTHMGFVLMGHYTKDVRRFHQHNMPHEEKAQWYKKMGKLLYNLGKEGFINIVPHQGNFSIQEGELILHDFGSGLEINKLTPEQAFGYLMSTIDLYFVRADALARRQIQKIYPTMEERLQIFEKLGIPTNPIGIRQIDLLSSEDSATYYENFLHGFFGEPIKLTVELCNIFNHVGYGSRNPSKEANLVNRKNLRRPWVLLWEGPFKKRKAWDYFKEVVVPTLTELSGT